MIENLFLWIDLLVGGMDGVKSELRVYVPTEEFRVVKDVMI